MVPLAFLAAESTQAGSTALMPPTQQSALSVIISTPPATALFARAPTFSPLPARVLVSIRHATISLSSTAATNATTAAQSMLLGSPARTQHTPLPALLAITSTAAHASLATQSMPLGPLVPTQPWLFLAQTLTTWTHLVALLAAMSCPLGSHAQTPPTLFLAPQPSTIQVAAAFFAHMSIPLGSLALMLALLNPALLATILMEQHAPLVPVYLLLGRNAATAPQLLFASQAFTFSTQTVSTAPKSMPFGPLVQAQLLLSLASTPPTSAAVNAWPAATSIVTAPHATVTSLLLLALLAIFNTISVESKPARFAMSVFLTV